MCRIALPSSTALRHPKTCLDRDSANRGHRSQNRQVLDLIATHLSITEAEEAEFALMEQSTTVTTLMDEIEAAQSRAKGPDSAADTGAWSGEVVQGHGDP
jgi:hypothetical protein